MAKREQFHQSFYFFAALVLAASLPLSHFMMGLSVFVLFLNWIFEWNWAEKWSRIKENSQFLVFPLFYLFYAIGIFKATDFMSVVYDLFVFRITFLVAPIVIISSKPLNSRQLQIFLSVFAAATLFACVWNFVYSLSHEYSDYREISRFIDHIRHGICVVMSIVFCFCYLINGKYGDKILKISYLVATAILFFYLIYSQTLSAILIFSAILFSFLIYLIIKSEIKAFKIATSVFIVAFFVSGVVYFSQITFDYFHPKEPVPDYSSVTASGRSYSFENDPMIENGCYIGNYVCEDELETAWNMRSDTAYTALISATLIRYLNSLGMRKDSAAVMNLSANDIRNVELKCANVVYSQRFNLKKAIYQTFFGIDMYKKYNHYNGSSLLQRIELWKTSWELIKKHPIFGVGLGNERKALDLQLMESNSPIAGQKFNRGSHNQFLTFWLAAGIFSLIYFIFMLLYPFVRMKNRISFAYFALFLIIFLSMFFEDTLNSQTGCLLYTIFAPLILFSNNDKNLI